MNRPYFGQFLTVVAVVSLGALTYAFWSSILLGGVVAALFLPVYRKVRTKVKSESWAAGLTTALFFVVVLTPVSIAMTKAAIQVGAFLAEFQKNEMTKMSSQKVSASLQGLETRFNELTEMVGLSIDFQPVQWLKIALGKVGSWLLDGTTNLLSGAPVMALELFIFVLAIFYFLKDGSRVKGFFANWWPYSTSHLERVKLSFQTACRSIVLASVFTGLVQAIIICIGAGIGGFEDLFLIGTITFLCSFVPVIGAAPIGLVLAIQQGATGDAKSAIILVVAAVAAGSIDNVMKPLLMAGNSTLHPLLSFVSIIGGIALMGLPGLFLGPILAEVSITLIDISRA